MANPFGIPFKRCFRFKPKALPQVKAPNPRILNPHSIILVAAGSAPVEAGEAPSQATPTILRKPHSTFNLARKAALSATVADGAPAPWRPPGFCPPRNV